MKRGREEKWVMVFLVNIKQLSSLGMSNRKFYGQYTLLTVLFYVK